MARTFPPDLLQAQIDWYEALDRLNESWHASTALRRRVLQLQVRIRWHPYWQRVDGTDSARWELRRQALQLLRGEGGGVRDGRL